MRTALDIHVVLGDGSHVDVEMQQACHTFLGERIVYYWARTYNSILVKSDLFSALRPCVSVVFVGEPLLPGSRLHSIFRVLETRDGYALSSDLAIHIIELPKLGLAQPEDGDVAEWGSFLAAKTDEELKELSMTHPNLDEAIMALQNLSVDASNRELVLQHDLAIANLVHHATRLPGPGAQGGTGGGANRWVGRGHSLSGGRPSAFTQ